MMQGEDKNLIAAIDAIYDTVSSLSASTRRRIKQPVSALQVNTC